MLCQCEPLSSEYDNRQKMDQAKLDSLTQMLCWLCGTLTATYHEDFLSCNPRLLAWWNQHQKTDTDRVLREMRQEVVIRQKQGITAPNLAQTFIERAELVHNVSSFHKSWFLKLAWQTLDELAEEHKQATDRLVIQQAALAKLTPEERQALGV